jgi:hypothetical protein
MEPWALASLLGAIVLGWCPLTAIAAVVTGAVALQRIARSDGRRRGTGLAIAGIAIATVTLLAEGWLLGRLQDEVAASMDEQANGAIRGVLGEGPPPGWDTVVTCTEAEVRAFRRSFAESVGALRSVSITRREATGISSPVVTTAFNAVGDRATAFGVARFAVQPATFPPVLSIRSLEVEVGERRLALPASGDGASAPRDPPEGTEP